MRLSATDNVSCEYCNVEIVEILNSTVAALANVYWHGWHAGPAEQQGVGALLPFYLQDFITVTLTAVVYCL